MPLSLLVLSMSVAIEFRPACVRPSRDLSRASVAIREEEETVEKEEKVRVCVK